MILILGVLSGSLAGAQEFKEYPSSARAAERDALASLSDAQSAKARLSEENAALQSRIVIKALSPTSTRTAA